MPARAMALAAGGGHGGAHGVIQTRLEVDSVVGLTSGLQRSMRKVALSNSTSRHVGRKRSKRLRLYLEEGTPVQPYLTISHPFLSSRLCVHGPLWHPTTVVASPGCLCVSQADAVKDESKGHIVSG